MRTCVFRSERVELNSKAHAEERAKAGRVLDVLRRQGRQAAIRWDDEYNDTSARGTVAVFAEN